MYWKHCIVGIVSLAMLLETMGHEMYFKKGTEQYSTLLARLRVTMPPGRLYPSADGPWERYLRIWTTIQKQPPISAKNHLANIGNDHIPECMKHIGEFQAAHPEIGQNCFDPEFGSLILRKIGTEQTFVDLMLAYLSKLGRFDQDTNASFGEHFRAIFMNANKPNRWNFDKIIEDVNGIFHQREDIEARVAEKRAATLREAPLREAPLREAPLRESYIPDASTLLHDSFSRYMDALNNKRIAESMSTYLHKAHAEVTAIAAAPIGHQNSQHQLTPGNPYSRSQVSLFAHSLTP